MLSAFTALAQPAVISSTNETGKYGDPYQYEVLTGIWPNPVDVTVENGLPPWATVGVNGNGNTIITGTPNEVADYTITIKVADHDFPLVFTTTDVNLSISKALLTVTADNKSRPYGSANPTLTITYTGLVNGDTPSSLTTQATANIGGINASTIAGTYNIAVSGATSPNYTITHTNGTLTISKVNLVAKADDQTRTYGSPNPTFTISYTGFVNGDDAGDIETGPTAGSTAGPTTGVSTVPITVTIGAATDENYTFTAGTNGNLVITQQPLTIKADNKTKVYGQANPGLTITYTGFQNGETSSVFTTQPTISLGSVDQTTSVGSYPITVSGATDDNYAITHSNGTLNITKATLVITADSKSRLYGDANPTATLSYVGFLNGNTEADLDVPRPSATINASGTTGVGTATITVSAPALDNNYLYELHDGTLTISKAHLTAVADNLSKPYHSANPTLSISYTGLKNGETAAVIGTPPTINTTAQLESNAGSYPITISGGSAANYDFTGYTQGTLTITKIMLTATADSKSRPYGTANPTLSITYTGFVNSEDASVINTPPTASTNANVTSTAGTYPITVSAGSANDENYSFNPVAGVLTVSKILLTLTADSKTKVYGAANPALTFVYSGFVNGENSLNITPPSITTSAVQNSPAGTYPISFTGGAADNYNFNFVNSTLTVSKAVLTVTGVSASKVYGTPNPALSVSYSGFISGEDASFLTTQPTASTTALASSPVGSYPVTPANGAAANYSFSYVAGTLTVNKAVITATADDKSRPYGSANPAFTITYSGFVNGDTEGVLELPNRPTASSVAGLTSDVNTYPITVTGGTDENYTFAYVAGELTVTKVNITATADSKSRAYGVANPALSITYTGMLNGDLPAVIDTPPSISTSATVTSPVTTYPIELSGGTDNNYNILLTNGVLTITKAAVIVTANNLSKTYGAALPTLTASYTGLVNGDVPATAFSTQVILTTTADASSPFGIYPITALGAVATNYSFSYAQGTLTVNKAVLTATADHKSRVYGASNPAFTITYFGFVNGDDAGDIAPPTATSPAGTTTASVGDYPIIPAGGSAANYTFSYVNGTLTITKATLIVTADNKVRLYGDANPAATLSYTGFLNGDNEAVLDAPKPSATINASGTTNVGSASITVSAPALDNNYVYELHDGTITINKATVTATADNKSKVYGSANPTLSISYSGLKNGEDASVLDQKPTTSTTAQTDSNAGTYPITATGGLDDNYTFAYAPGTLTINKALLTATADNKSRVYGAANPGFSVTYTGLLGDDVPGEINVAPGMSTSATVTSDAGNYAIDINGGSDDNYTFTYVPGTLIIGKATLTAKPDNKTRIYGATNPSFTITYTGFANGDDASKIDVAPTINTMANTTTVVGAYNINASGASDLNYAFTYNPGTLTITKAPLTLTANPQSKVYGTTNPALTITYTGLQNGETSSVLDAPVPSISTTAGDNSPVGGYPITITAGTDDNYAYTVVNGTLTVTRATLTITADNKTRAYNTVNPTFTATYSGFVGSDGVGNITVPTLSTTATQTSNVGTHAINVTGGSSANYTFAYQEGVLTITKANPVVTWNTPAAITYGTPLGATQLNASANVAGTFDYRTSDNTPASGVILPAGNGQVLKVTFTPSDGGNYNTITDFTTTINVNKANPVITWANPAAIIYGDALNTTSQLNATASVPGTFVYTPAAGTVLNAGANQTLRADFTPADGANYNPVTNITRQITVNKATPVVTWANPAAIVYGTPLSATQLNSTFSVPGTPQYVPSIGTIIPAGMNQPLVVNWTPTDQTNYNSVNGTQVLITVLKATPVITWSNPADITYGTALSGTQLNASSNVAGTLVYNPASGIVLQAGAGQTLSVAFTPTNTHDYNSVPVTSVTINVNKANPVITWPNPTAITYGTALSGAQLNASSSVPGTFVYSPLSGTVLNAGVNQTLTATLTPADQANFNTIVTNKSITVNKATPVVTWSNPGSITYGTPLGPVQQNATANVPGTFEYAQPEGTILNTGVGQTLSVKFTPADQTNYAIVASTTVQITVNKATPVITWATPLPIKVGVALSSTQLNPDPSVPGSFVFTPPAGTSFASEGVQVLRADFTPADPANYNSVPNTTVQITVSSKENPVIDWPTPAAITYGTLLSGTQLNALANVPGSYSYSPSAGIKLNAGTNQTLSVTFTPTDGVNYNTVVKTVQINVNKATLTATATSATRAYGNANPSFTITYSGFIGSDNAGMIDTPPTATCTAIAADPAGSTFPIVPAGGVDNNYTFSYVNGTLGINKAPLTATANNKSRMYGDANPTFTISYSGFVNGDDETKITQPSASSTGAITSSVGIYPIVLTGGSATNYNINPVAGTLTITQQILVVIADDATKVYGQVNPAFTFRYLGFRNGDNATAIGTPPTTNTPALQSSGAGSYAINVVGGSSLNYDLLRLPGTLTITKAPLTAKADNKTRVYGQANPANTITYAGFVNSDVPTSITQPTITGASATPDSDTGTYPIQLSGGSSANYDITLQNGTLTVTKAPLTAKADNKTKVYGQPNPIFTISYTGFLNDDGIGDITVPTASSTATTATGVGSSYPITVSGGSAQNYDIVPQSGLLSITKAPLTAKANDRTRMYGATNPNLTITYTGFLNGDGAGSITPPVTSTSATETSPFGVYPITITGGSAANYTLTLAPGQLTVSKAILTAKADDKSKFYGEVNPTYTISYSGFVNGEGPDVFITPITITPPPNATVSSPPGNNYTISLSGGLATNYTFVLQNGTLTINKAPLTATVQSKSRAYGASNLPITITYSGFVNGDTPGNISIPTISTPATATSNVGTYPITLSGTTTNYAFTFVPGTLTVTKARVKVTANNQTKVYGEQNPELTVEYDGLLNGETPAVIDTPPTVSTTADQTSPVDDDNYEITLTGGLDNNYDFDLENATLSISKAPLTATADDKIRYYGDPDPEYTITYTGFVNGDGPADITEPVASSTTTSTSAFGDYPIILTGGDANNYTITLEPGIVSVKPTLLTITAVNQTRKYGEVNPELELTYHGFVNGQTIDDIETLPTATTTANVLTNVGTYDINVGGGSDPNYTLAYVKGSLKITPAVVTATADPKTTTYGTIPPFTITYSGFANGENSSVIDTPPTASTTATTTSGTGSYDITLSGGIDNNYTINKVNSTLTIGKATLTVKADNKSRVVGLSNPEFTLTYSGFKNNEGVDVINTRPTATTTAVTNSPAGTYPINVAGGSDDHYDFQYTAGVLTLILDNAPVVKSFQLDVDEDSRLNLTLPLFVANYTDDSNKIGYIKITSLPANGTIFKGNTRIVANDEILVTNNTQLEELYYMPNSNYTGTDNFGWNLFDGSFLAANSATVTIRVKPVNDPPTLTNIETDALLYSLGDPAKPITGQMIINDIDDIDIYSASVVIASNFASGDELSITGINNTKITTSFNTTTGELTLTGRETRATYQDMLTRVAFSSPVTGEATVSEKSVTFAVRDSVASSNIVSRTVSITEVFPEINIVNAFTPNGDGHNDVWDILELDNYTNINIRVYNNEGVTVYTCTDNTCEWDGTLNGKPLASGAYFYTIDLNQGKRRYQGTVTILK
ncbi:MAG TPA: MBG domain-containing protein [Cyclobacteriaceae bacterium]|nr:MBG domain-containing protein [Cyclobacteriaceae bacterium]